MGSIKKRFPFIRGFMVPKNGKIIGDVYMPLVTGWTILIGKQGLKAKKIGDRNELEEDETEVVVLLKMAKGQRERITALSNFETTNLHHRKSVDSSLISWQYP